MVRDNIFLRTLRISPGKPTSDDKPKELEKTKISKPPISTESTDQ